MGKGKEEERRGKGNKGLVEEHLCLITWEKVVD